MELIIIFSKITYVPKLLFIGTLLNTIVCKQGTTLKKNKESIENMKMQLSVIHIKIYGKF